MASPVINPGVSRAPGRVTCVPAVHFVCDLSTFAPDLSLLWVQITYKVRPAARGRPYAEAANHVQGGQDRDLSNFVTYGAHFFAS